MRGPSLETCQSDPIGGGQIKPSNHHRWAWRSLLLVLPLIGALCCGDDEPSVEGLETVAKFEAARLATYCGQLAPCCNDDGTALSVEACQQQLDNFSGTLERPTLRYDAQAARRCIDAYAGLVSTRCELVGEEAVASACRDVVVGTVARGGRCADDRDCAPVGNEPSRCHIEFDVQPPVTPYCEPDPARAIRQHLSEGDACSGQCAPVPRGDLCPGTADAPMCFIRDGLQCENGACAPLAADGSACSVDELCSSGHCFFPDPTVGIGVCRTPAALDACREDHDCPTEHFCRRLPNTVEDGVVTEGPVRCEPRFTPGTECLEDRECVSNNCGSDGLCRDEPWIRECAQFVVYPFVP